MATSWSGSVELVAGQVAVASCTIIRMSGDSCSIRLIVDSPQLDMAYTFTDSDIVSGQAAPEPVLSVQAVNITPESGGYLCVGFTASASGVATVEWSVLSGDSVLRDPAVTAQ